MDDNNDLYDNSFYKTYDNKPRDPNNRKHKQTVKKGSRKDVSDAKNKALGKGTNNGRNAEVLKHTLRVAALGKFNYKDPDLLVERLNTYYNYCIEDDIKPTVAETALALGMGREQYNRILHGEFKWVNTELLNIFKISYNILTAQTEIFMQEGSINPVAGIFLMRNNMDYRNDVEMTVNVANNQVQSISNKEILEQTKLLSKNSAPLIGEFEEKKND